METTVSPASDWATNLVVTAFERGVTELIAQVQPADRHDPESSQLLRLFWLDGDGSRHQRQAPADDVPPMAMLDALEDASVALVERWPTVERHRIGPAGERFEIRLP